MNYEEEFAQILDASASTISGMEQSLKYDVAKIVMDYIERSGQSQKAFAKSADVDPGKISKVLQGEENITLKTIAKLFKAMEKRPRITVEQERPTKVVEQTTGFAQLYLNTEIAGAIQ